MKKNFIFCVIFLFALHSWGQTFYVKLKKPIEESQSLVSKVSQEFTVNFIKSELTSKVLNGHIYKINHSLSKCNAEKLHKLLKKDPAVIYASLLQEPVVPPNDIPPTTTDFILSQSYLEPDPGVDANYAWANGSDGSNVTVRDVEYGLNVNHEEFVGRNAKIADGMTISSSATFSFTTHGTATAGIVYSDDGGYGTKGIAYNANRFILYPEWQEGQSWDRVQAVTNAVNDAAIGDVIIYEMQITGANGNFAMAEYDPLVWDLTLSATNKGAVVVAAAGNGGENLDSSGYDDYHARGDSGAIIVGASLPNTDHPSASFSTYGTRVNINAWGASVFTTGYGAISFDNDVNQYYTDSFGGTSSATAISGGCVANLQSFYYTLTGGSYMTSQEMRNLLEETGTNQTNNDRPIGQFINMRAAMERLVVLSNDDESFGDQIIAYPNPTHGLVHIKNDNLENADLEVYNTLGKRILSTQLNDANTTVDISQFSSGVYFFKIISGSKSGIKRIIKN